MELTSKQRAQLRGLANTLDTIVQVGKDGINENLVKQVDDALEARELIKCRVLENSMLTAREACQELSVLTRSEGVQVIGSRFVLYRTSYSLPREKRIELVMPGRKTPAKADKTAEKAKKPAEKTKKTGKDGKPAAKTSARSGARAGAKAPAKKAVVRKTVRKSGK